MSADLNSLLSPNDDKQFEQLCQHVLQHRFKTLSGQAYGRNGQAQHGVDFYIEVPAGNGGGGSAAVKIIGVQCKHKDRLHEGVLGVNEVEAEVKKAKGFLPALTAFIIATSAPTDTKPQDKARELNGEHQKKSPPLFSVEVWFWEKLRDEFCKDPGLLHEILKRFYPNLPLAQAAHHGNLHQLPSSPAHFTGRDEELAGLEKELTAAQAVGATISGVRTKLQGAPGVGKTALATVLAHKLKDRYPDAQLYLNLRGAGADMHGQHSSAVKPVTPVVAMQSIIHAFHPEEKLPEELDKLSVKYNGVLNEAGRVLLFLDNAADVEQVRPLLPPTNCLLLVTSRSQFTLPGLVSRDIDCLLPENSQKLLLKLAPRIKGHDVEAAELCGHLPLALEVFAGVVSDKKLYLVPDLLRRLREGREKLAPVEAAFQVSYDLLADNLRKRWTLLAVFPASFDLAAAEAVWEEKADSGREAMQLLVNASLVEFNEANGRFRLHDLLRQFCDGKLATAERTIAKLKYAEHYQGIGNTANQLYLKGGENVLRGLELFDRERMHIESAFEWLQSRKDEASSTLLNSLVNVATTISILRFHPHQRVRWLEAKLNASRIIKDRWKESVSLGNLGLAYDDLGDVRKAIDCHEQHRALAGKIGDRHGEGNALGNLGLAYFSLGDLRKAIEFYEQSLKLHIKLGNRRGERSAYGNLGLAYFDSGDSRKAIEFHEQCLKLNRELGDQHGEATALGNLGNAHCCLGDLQKGIEFYKKHLNIAHVLGDRRGEGNALGNLGNAYESLGELRKAIEFYEQSIAIDRAIGDRSGEATGLWNSGRVFVQMGERLQAILNIQAALFIFEAIEDPFALKARAALAELRGQA